MRKKKDAVTVKREKKKRVSTKRRTPGTMKHTKSREPSYLWISPLVFWRLKYIMTEIGKAGDLGAWH